ncbi:MAG: succinate dehydrogenase cytochrome b subunit [Bdellovibrionales bacterium]|nr:succinate dehydrogenase cytochrome b subunit [Bdellovibrionales bacterium]
MNKATYLLSTIGKKQIMALAGLALCGFVLTHAVGNLFLFVSPEAYNHYGHAITSNPLIYLAEVGLVVFFAFHVVAGVLVTIRNMASRPQKYAVSSSGDKATSLTTKTMAIQGMVLFGFIVLHLITFKYGASYPAQADGVAVRDLFRLVYEVFQDPIYVFGYIACLLVLSFHLSHGLASSLQTLGLHHPKYTEKLKIASILYGVLVAGIFISQPLYMYFIYKG